MKLRPASARRRIRVPALFVAAGIVLATLAASRYGYAQEQDAPRVLGNRARSPVPTPTIIAEAPPAFGRVIYRAAKAASYESLGVSMIACRHRDPAPRSFAVEFFERYGKKVSTFGPSVVPNVAPGRKVIFVSDGTHFSDRDNSVVNVRLGHLVDGRARVISDARAVHCMAKMRFDPGARAKTYWRSMGFYREGVGATPAPIDW